MKQKVNLNKQVFSKTQYPRVVNTEFTQLVPASTSTPAVENVSVDEIQAPMSQVRMVQLFLNSETEPLFKKMVENLQQTYGTTNLTDTVYRALENENANSQS